MPKYRLYLKGFLALSKRNATNLYSLYTIFWLNLSLYAIKQGVIRHNIKYEITKKTVSFEDYPNATSLRIVSSKMPKTILWFQYFRRLSLHCR